MPHTKGEKEREAIIKTMTSAYEKDERGEERTQKTKLLPNDPRI